MWRFPEIARAGGAVTQVAPCGRGLTFEITFASCLAAASVLAATARATLHAAVCDAQSATWHSLLQHCAVLHLPHRDSATVGPPALLQRRH